MKKNTYYVIGGQYESYCYGARPTLTGAKRLASKVERSIKMLKSNIFRRLKK